LPILRISRGGDDRRAEAGARWERLKSRLRLHAVRLRGQGFGERGEYVPLGSLVLDTLAARDLLFLSRRSNAADRFASPACPPHGTGRDTGQGSGWRERDRHHPPLTK
jgi:hypothetical protein